jgi:hypothetical protein
LLLALSAAASAGLIFAPSSYGAPTGAEIAQAKHRQVLQLQLL